MDASVVRRVLNGLGANVVSQIIAVVIQLAGVPILLYAWGPRAYGEWLILFAIPAFLSMSDFGFSQSAANDMAAQLNRGNESQARIVFHSLSMFVLGIIVLSLGLCCLVFWVAPLYAWMSIDTLSETALRVTLMLLACDVLVRLAGGVIYAGFRATGDYALYVWLAGITRLAQYLCMWVVALAGGGMVAAAATYLGVRLCITPFLAILLHRRQSRLRVGFSFARLSGLRGLFKPALANIAVPLSQAVNLQGMVIVVGSVLGPIAVVIFSTIRTLCRLSVQLVRSISHAAEPEFAAAHGSNDRALIQTLFVHALRGGFWLSLLGAAGLFVFGPLVLKLWTHGQVAMHMGLFFWLLAAAVVSSVTFNILFLLRAMNQHVQLALMLLGSATVSIGMAAWALSATRDLAYAGLVLFVSETILAVLAFKASTRLDAAVSMKALIKALDPFPLLNMTFARLGKCRAWSGS